MKGLMSLSGSDLKSQSLTDDLNSVSSFMSSSRKTKAPSTASSADTSVESPAATEAPATDVSTPATASSGTSDGAQKCEDGFVAKIKSWWSNTFGDGDKCSSSASRRLRLE
jgi:hypothetical protein